MHPPAQQVAGGKIGFGCRPHVIAGEPDVQRRPLQQRERLARAEPHRGVQAQGSVVIGRLDEADTGEIAGREMVDRRLHQQAAGASVLRIRVDRDRPDPGDWRALVGEIAADNPAAALSDDAVPAGNAQQHRQHAGGSLDRGEIGWEIVPLGQCRKGAIEDRAAGGGILRYGRADGNRHFTPPVGNS